MKNQIILTITLLTAILNVSVDAQVSKFGKWQLQSFFKGFNISDSNYVDTLVRKQIDFSNLKATGANLAHIATAGFNSIKSPYISQPKVISRLDSMVSYCKKAKLYYVIAIRTGPGRYDVDDELKDTAQKKSTIWKNKLQQGLYASMLKNIAMRYSSDTLFVGLNLMVEPVPFASVYEYPRKLDSALTANSINMQALYKLFIDSVRSADALLPLIVQTVNASDPEFFGLLKKQTDTKIVYDFHSYTPYEYSHNSPPGIKNYPGNYTNIAYNNNPMTYNYAFLDNTVLDSVKKFQALNNVPIFMGEFGLIKTQNGGEQYLTDYANIAKSHCWHFALWSFGTKSDFDYFQMPATYSTAVLAMFFKYNKLYWHGYRRGKARQKHNRISKSFHITNNLFV